MSSRQSELDKVPPDIDQTEPGVPPPKMLLLNAKLINWSSMVSALLQSECSAVIAISGLRVAIDLGAFSAAASVDAPRMCFNQDAIRISMIALALAASLLNLL